MNLYRVTMALLGVLLFASSVSAFAQGVYVTKGEGGPVFSDKPQPGAKEVSLPPLSVVPAVKENKPTPAPSGSARPAAPSPSRDGAGASGREEAAALPYRSFLVLSPEDGGSVLANTALFEVRLATEPPLQLGEGHAFAVSINGRPVGRRFTTSDFMVPPEFWGDTLPPPNQQVQLEASIVGSGGQVLMRAAPVRFYMRYASVMNPLNRPHPRPPVAPRPLPGRPEPESRPVETLLPGKQVETLLPIDAAVKRDNR